MNQLRLHVNRNKLLITHKSARPREAGLLDECAIEILSAAKDDSQGCCHPERSEGSLADLWVVNRNERKGLYLDSFAHFGGSYFLA